jgi:hypothetical protein
MLGKENRIGWPLDGWTNKATGTDRATGNEAVAAGEQNQMLAVWSRRIWGKRLGCISGLN